MSKDKKQSRLKKVIGQEGKRLTAVVNTEIPSEQQPPAFSLRYLTGDYCLTNCEIEEKAAFASKLHRLSQLTWKEIQSQNRHKLGYEKIPQNAIKTPIPVHVTEEVNLIAFRFDGKKPMVGWRDLLCAFPRSQLYTVRPWLSKSRDEMSALDGGFLIQLYQQALQRIFSNPTFFTFC